MKSFIENTQLKIVFVQRTETTYIFEKKKYIYMWSVPFYDIRKYYIYFDP